MHSDHTKVGQTLMNLLSNAIKFTEGGTISVSASRDRDEAGQEWIVLAVSDDGIGMTREQLGRLFRPFVQADASTTRKYGGTGLGLTISRRFCQLMGGEISVASEPDAGSTFTVRLPADLEAWLAQNRGPAVGPSLAVENLKEERTPSWPGSYLSKTTS